MARCAFDKAYICVCPRHTFDVPSPVLSKTFLIKNAHAFSEVVLPKFWKHNNLQSFIRQLNMYSFQKTRHDSNYREFRQPNFMKGRRDLLVLIKRKTQGKQDSSTNRGASNKDRTLDDEDGGDDDNDGEDEDDDCDEQAVKDGLLPFASLVSELKGERLAASGDEVDALRHYVAHLEQQLWTLTSKYAQLEERLVIVEQQQRSVDDNVMKHRDPPSEGNTLAAASLSSSSSNGGSIVRMISIDPNSEGGRKIDTHHANDPHRAADGGVAAFSSVSVSVSISQNKRMDCGGLASDVACKTAKCDHGIGGGGDSGRGGGLHAIAAAASLLDAHISIDAATNR